MKLKFKVQPYQTSAVESVVDCFAGQPLILGAKYRIDPGTQDIELEYTGFKNPDLQLTDTQLIENIHAVQRRQNLALSDKLVSDTVKINVEQIFKQMSPGTDVKSIWVNKKKNHRWTRMNMDWNLPKGSFWFIRPKTVS